VTKAGCRTVAAGRVTSPEMYREEPRAKQTKERIDVEQNSLLVIVGKDANGSWQHQDEDGEI